MLTATVKHEPAQAGSEPAREATVFDVQRFSVHDGPGIRTTAFLKGCPLSCAWCQNPESICTRPQLMFDAHLCIGCGACAKVCDATRDRAGCRDCGRCADACPTGARRMAGRRVSADDVVAEAMRDEAFYADGGGVTFGGGEPLAQWTFVRAASRELKRRGIHVAVDTSAYAPVDVIRQLPEEVDLAIVDLKLVSHQKHLKYTGVDNARILDAIRHLSSAMPGRLWLSLPLVPGVHDADDVVASAEFVASLDPAPPVRFIPYHKLGKSKYEALGRAAPEFDGDVDSLVARAGETFAQRGLHIL